MVQTDQMTRPNFHASGFSLTPIGRPAGEAFWWIECCACGNIAPVSGPRFLPKGWAAIHPVKEGKRVGYDVYASPKCIQRAAVRVAHDAGTKDVCVRVNAAVPPPFIGVNLVAPEPEKQDPQKKE